jgi:regulator of RNase E activity RraA
MLTVDQLAVFRQFDTPTICNAIETFEVRGRAEGFTGMDIRCIAPSLGAMVGYAVTVTVDSTTPYALQTEEGYAAWLQAMEAAPKPGVLVFQDVGPAPRKSAHFGDVMGTIAQRLGMIGLLTDGGVRDILELERMGFHLFASGVVPSHGSPRLLAANVPVVIDGVCIRPGDLIHGDVHGVTVIPTEVASRVAQAADQVLAAEAALKAFVNGPDFTIERLLQRRFKH